MAPLTIGHFSATSQEIMVDNLAYKPNIREVITRLEAFYKRQARDRIFATFEVPNRTLAEYKTRRKAGHCGYPDINKRIRFWDRVLSENAGLEDDSVPSAYPTELDQGLYGAVLGGEIKFTRDPDTGWISSMVEPLLNDWEEFGRLKIDPDHPWVEKYERQLKIFSEFSYGKFGVSHFILINGLNFVYELVGATRTYLDLYENPEMIRKAGAFAVDLNIWLQDRFFTLTPRLNGGTCSNMVQWIPGKIVSESVDPFTMTSVADFEKWGREPIERVFSHYDGGVTHVHANGRHQLEAVSSLKGLKAIYLADENGAPPAIDILSELKKRCGDMPLIIEILYHRFAETLERRQLAGGVFYRVKATPNQDAANRLMEKVRAYRI